MDDGQNKLRLVRSIDDKIIAVEVVRFDFRPWRISELLSHC